MVRWIKWIIIVRVIIIVAWLIDFLIKILFGKLGLCVIYMIRASLIGSNIRKIITSCIIITWSFIRLITRNVSFIRRNIIPKGIFNILRRNSSIITLIVINVHLKWRRKARWVIDLFLYITIFIRFLDVLLWIFCQTRRCMKDLIFGVFTLD